MTDYGREIHLCDRSFNKKISIRVICISTSCNRPLHLFFLSQLLTLNAVNVVSGKTLSKIIFRDNPNPYPLYNTHIPILHL